MGVLFLFLIAMVLVGILWAWIAGNRDLDEEPSHGSWVPGNARRMNTMVPICVCGNRGYSALVNNEHYEDCPAYKPNEKK